MGTKNDMVLVNQFGEESINKVKSIGQSVSDAQPAKAGVQAIVAIATVDATDLASAEALANACKAKINEILAALKVVS
jgi:hypothetical protein